MEYELRQSQYRSLFAKKQEANLVSNIERRQVHPHPHGAGAVADRLKRRSWHVGGGFPEDRLRLLLLVTLATLHPPENASTQAARLPLVRY